MQIRPRWLSAPAAEGTNASHPARALQQLADACVPVCADACFIDLVTPSGELRRVAAAVTGTAAGVPRDAAPAAADPAPAGGEPGAGDAATRSPDAAAVPLRRRPLPAPGDSVCGDVLAHGRSRLVEVVTDYRALATDEAEQSLFERLAPRSAVVAAIPGTGGQTAGVLTLLLSRRGAAFDAASLADAEELAAQVGLLTANERLEQRAREATRARSEFLAIVSHELRTPLNIILGYTELMLNGIPAALAERSAHQVERIRASARYLLQRIEEVLAYARLEGGRESARIEPLRVPGLVEELTELIAPLAESKRLGVEVPAPPEIEIHTDATHLRQILLHLLSNAVRFTAAGKIGLSVTVERETIRFEVSDTGRGMADNEMERIFDPFWQADPLATRRAQGTGLGLSIARRLAHLLGGEISCRSVAGSGSTFTLRVPLRPAQA